MLEVARVAFFRTGSVHDHMLRMQIGDNGDEKVEVLLDGLELSFFLLTLDIYIEKVFIKVININLLYLCVTHQICCIAALLHNDRFHTLLLMSWKLCSLPSVWFCLCKI